MTLEHDLLILLRRTISREAGSLPKGQLRTTITEYLRRRGKLDA